MILGFTKTFIVGGKLKPTDFESKIKEGKKLHTIRFDEKSRWCEGKKIHFATGVRTSRYNCFKEGVCLGTQTIEIVGRDVYVDGCLLSIDEVEYLALNDGFDSVNNFWEWFYEDCPFEGIIIHWTDLRY